MVYASSIIFAEYPIEEACKRLQQCGYDGTELWQKHLHFCGSPQLRRLFREFTERIGLGLFGLNVVGFDYFKPFGTETERAETLRQLKADIDFAHDLDLRHVFQWEGPKPSAPGRSVSEKDCLASLIEIFSEALEYGADREICIYIEPHPHTLAMDDRFVIELCDKIDSRRFGIIYDCAHYGVARPDDYITAIRNLGHRIRHVHFSDSDRKTRDAHLPPGLGCLDLEGIVKALEETGFSGMVTLDLYAWPLPEEGARLSIPYLQGVINRLGLENKTLPPS